MYAAGNPHPRSCLQTSLTTNTKGMASYTLLYIASCTGHHNPVHSRGHLGPFTYFPETFSHSPQAAVLCSVSEWVNKAIVSCGQCETQSCSTWSNTVIWCCSSLNEITRDSQDRRAPTQPISAVIHSLKLNLIASLSANWLPACHSSLPHIQTAYLHDLLHHYTPHSHVFLEVTPF